MPAPTTPTFRCPLSLAGDDIPAAIVAAGVAAWTERLTDLGLQPGQVLAIQGRPTAEMLYAMWAAWELGLTIAPISTRDPIALRERKCRLIRARDLLVQEDLVPSPSIIAQRERGDGQSSSPTFSPEQAERDASIIFTSGSTGEPKGVLHPHAAHIANAAGAAANLPLGPEDRWLLSLPLFHVGGLAILYRCAAAGATVVLPDWEADLATNLAQGRVSHASMVPTQLRRLLDSPHACWAANLRAVLLGGGPIPPELVRDARGAGVPILTTYGCTEAASQITTTAIDDPESAFASAGRALPGRQLSIAETGEILVRGPILASAYLGPNGPEPLTDADGWYHTGDVGHIDAEGRLHVDGRLGTRFISGGENIQPEAIERALLDQPSVRAACVVPRPDADYGMRPVAFVDGTVDPDALAERVPRFMLPDAILPWPPDMLGLKPDRRRLTQLAAKSSR